METINRIINIIDVNIIFCLPSLIVTLLLTNLFFKNRFQTGKAFNVVRYTIISYTTLYLLVSLVGFLLHSDEYDYTSRATGPYWWSYWLMFSGAVLLPYTLFFKKLGLNPLYLLCIAVFLKIGRYFEMFVIYVTSLHRDYFPGNSNEWLDYFPTGLLLIVLQGFLLGIVLLGIVEAWHRKNTSNGLNN
ncbi:hypothetical protein [Flavobacterium pedocola]